jgi:hypothetical protein
MNSRTVSRRIDKLLDQAQTLAFEEVCRQALRIMEKHKNLTHFCMAMGSVCFYDKNGPHDGVRSYTKRLHRFIDSVDRHLYITGMPVRMERMPDGSIAVVTDW